MKFKLIKLRFLTAVHFGEGGLNTGNSTLHADTLFSALCLEAVRHGEEILQRLLSAVRERGVRITNGLPYIGNDLYIPKPLMEITTERVGDSVLKKALKKLEYLPIEELEKYEQGGLDIPSVVQYFHSRFGAGELVEKACIRPGDDALPYGLEVFRYAEGSGLYILFSYESEKDLELMEMLITELGYTGIGGKRSAGYGQFEPEILDLPKRIQSRCVSEGYKRYMSLSGALPKDEELESALEGAAYRVEKRSGFVSSMTYAPEFRKKKDLYLCAAGSVFQYPFKGDIYDVSDGGKHPVYRYALPFWMGV